MSLYIHFPWCLSKCPYCDFNSCALSETQDIADYINKLLIDLEIEAAKAHNNFKLNTIYFGGGTPSLLPPSAVKKIINKAMNLFSSASNIEITLEANPGTINLELCEQFKDAGINRISLGVQSFNDEKLKSIGRIHNAAMAQNAIKAIKLANFNNFNLDIMFGLPGQNTEDAISDLKIALDFAPPHFSWYQLTLESNTGFAIKRPVLPCSEEVWDMQQAGQDLLAQAGLLQYEVSAYSSVEYKCRHNMNYWQYGDYLGIGAGAHGKITLANGIIKRYWKIADPKQYLQVQDLIAGEEIVEPKKSYFEFMLNALRLYQPISHALFYERTGFNISVVENKLRYAENLGLIKLQDDTITVTLHGRNFLNDLLEIFL